jgi:hypothetical protein
MDLDTVMQAYFRGEKQLAWGLVALGVGLIGAAVWVWRTQSGPFAWWLLVPVAVLGVGAAVGGAAFAHKTDAQVAALTAELGARPAALVAAESARMAKVNANWPRLKLAWAVLAMAAIVLLEVVKRDWSSGLGLALMLIATTGFFIDVFAERRAVPHTEALARARGEGG